MELISIHVPKTAGVTFRAVLQAVYGKAAVAFDYGDWALDPLSPFQTDPDRWHAEAERQAAELPSAARVIHGHFGGGKYDRAFPAARKIVWLREPVARLVSHYHYWLNLPPTPHSLHQRLLKEQLSILEFARLEGMRNVLARVFLRDCRLEDFAFIGIQERFTDDLQKLARLLGWSGHLSVGEENRNPQTGYQSQMLSDADRQRIAEMNAEDVTLYQKALSSQGRNGHPLGTLDGQPDSRS